ncbi:conserved oligomeric Golgi complex subunit 7, partial [Tremellales sp. Uapishka_1]
VPPNLQPLDKHLNDLLTQLSLLSQDTSSSLEQTIHDISRTVPRLTYDLQFMRESATSLQSSLQSVQARVARQTSLDTHSSQESEEVQTHKALEKLSYLDKLKTRMESARDILREAESWSTLESEITSLIASSSWNKAGERLAEASRSMIVFQNTPSEYETRKSLLVSLQNELETSLSKALRDALEKNDTESCAAFYNLFEMMEREQEFENYYFANRRMAIVDEWNNVVLLDTAQSSTPPRALSEGSTPTKFTTFLPKFYSTLLSTLTLERPQIAKIFPPESAALVLSTFIQTTLDGLSPSLQSRLSAMSEYYGAEALPEIIRAFKSTEELAVAVQSIMDKVAFNTRDGQASGSALEPIISPAPSTSSETPRKRLSVSHRYSRRIGSISEESPSPTIWETTLYEPFLDLQSSYASLETKYLAHQLKYDSALTITASSRNRKEDAGRILWERAVTVFAMAEDSIGRCLSFTHGYGAIGLLESLNYFVAMFLENNQRAVLELASSKRSSNRSITKDELDFEVEGLDYSNEDWESFQLGLHVLKTCRDIEERLGAFEGNLQFALSEIASTLAINPLTMGESSAFYKSDTTLGAITLLQQSPLNSADLHATIDSLSTSPIPLEEARTGLAKFTRASQLFLQSIILSPLENQLAAYPTLPVFAQPSKAPRRGELQIPTFSLSPTDTIARVSEGLLNLLRVFEVYASDDALAYSIETLPFVDSRMLSAGAELSSEMVLSTWVSSLALSLLSYLTSRVLARIERLSESGAKQLASDLGYLSNAVRALDVEWEELEKWKEGAEIEDEGEWRRLEGRGAILERVGRVRGWSTG